MPEEVFGDCPDLISKLRTSIDSLEWSPIPTGERRTWRIGLPRNLEPTEMVLVVYWLQLPPGRFSFSKNETSGSPELHIFSEPEFPNT